MKVIEKAIYTYGVYPSLVVLKEQQEQENYELCQELKEVIDRICFGRGIISSQVDEDSLKKVLENILKHRRDPSAYEELLQHKYIPDFKKMIGL